MKKVVDEDELRRWKWWWAKNGLQKKIFQLLLQYTNKVDQIKQYQHFNLKSFYLKAGSGKCWPLNEKLKYPKHIHFVILFILQLDKFKLTVEVEVKICIVFTLNSLTWTILLSFFTITVIMVFEGDDNLTRCLTYLFEVFCWRCFL